jgi:hypothetical protein
MLFDFKTSLFLLILSYLISNEFNFYFKSNTAKLSLPLNLFNLSNLSKNQNHLPHNSHFQKYQINPHFIMPTLYSNKSYT